MSGGYTGIHQFPALARIYGPESSTNIPHIIAFIKRLPTWCTRRYIMRRTTLVLGRNDAFMITETTIWLARIERSTQLMPHTFIQHDGTRQLTQWLRKQGHLALSDIQRQFPIIPHFIRLLRWGILDRSQYRRKRPSATLPSSLSSTGVRWRHSGARTGV
jgi:hypothetical protein